MTEPLVTRKEHGIPYLRGTPLSPIALQAWMDVGLSTAEIRARWPHLLGDWSDADIERVLTYPRVEQIISAGERAWIAIGTEGHVKVEPWFIYPADIPGVIAALERAQEIVGAWVLACDEWEASDGT